MRRLTIVVLLFAISHSLSGQTGQQGDYTKLANEGDFVIHDFVFRSGEKISDLRLHYVTWGAPRRNAAGEVVNAVLLLHGTLGTGLGWGRPSPQSPQRNLLLGPGAPFDTNEYFVIAPDTIGSGKSSRPSDGLHMKFPHYNLEDIVSVERLLVEHLGVKHLAVVAGASMGGRQTWQWGVQYPDYMDALVPMISAPFPNAGRRGVIDFLPEAIIKADPAWQSGEYKKNPEGARYADLLYSIFLRTPEWYDHQLPARADAEKWVREGHGQFDFPDANDFIYMMELNNDFDAWSKLNRIHCPVMSINMANDNMVPVELQQAQRIVSRLKDATYVEVKEEAAYGHGALSRTINVWGPQLRTWLEDKRVLKVISSEKSPSH